MNNNNIKVLKQLGAFEVKIKDIYKKDTKEYKGKTYPAKVAVTFEHPDGRVIDGDYRIPAAEFPWDEKQWKELLRVAKVQKASELKGKTVAIVVAPNHWEGKTFWKVQGVYETTFLKDEQSALDSMLDSLPTNEKSALDDIGF